MKLFYRDYGSGEALLILHGLLGSLDNWHSLAERFGRDYSVYALDQRNHGRSPHSPIMTYHAMREDLRQFCDDHNLMQACVLGHSMGGKVAMEFALAYPERVRKLVVVDIAPRAYDPLHDHLLDALSLIDLSAYHSRREIDDALAKDIQSIPVRMFLLKNLKRTDTGTYVWKMNLPALRNQYGELNRGLEGRRTFTNPALFVRALQSDYILPSDYHEIREFFPASRIEVLKTGHWVHAESPDEFYRLVNEFLKE